MSALAPADADAVVGRRGGIAVHELASVAAPWRGVLALVATCVVAAALLELVPPFVLRTIVDDHLTAGRTTGLLALGALYLGATAAAVGMSFAGAYLAVVGAQGALHELRVRLFAHLQRLPIGYFDRTPLGEVISRCTADVETVDVLFSSGVAQLVANMVRLAFVAVAMVVLSPPLALVSLVVVPPLVGVTRFLQVRIRAAERANRIAVGELNTHLQETLGLHFAHGRVSTITRREPRRRGRRGRRGVSSWPWAAWRSSGWGRGR